ncbi:hypothetical protein CAMRE0001_0918 [Campylobacter rectus RM3267]|uniref:Uncharacterized protein n=1 Tax=Campylobacter rectus RM3267 TaxID=553218 RepID=B9D241_CAMRE|nr:hypothetical protein CAMRE0001_0918 [Campylobacter rectus RM3267]
MQDTKIYQFLPYRINISNSIIALNIILKLPAKDKLCKYTSV